MERQLNALDDRHSAADEQRRKVLFDFVLTSEELMDRIRLLVNPGAIGQYHALRGLIEIAREVGAEIPGDVQLTPADNPLPAVADTDAKVLRDLGLRARAWRGMVQIVGPKPVADAATSAVLGFNSHASRRIASWWQSPET